MSTDGRPKPRHAWVFNLDAELELAFGGLGYNTSTALARNLERHGEGARKLLGPGDVALLGPGNVRHGETLEDPRAFIGRVWCPTPLALKRLRDAGITPEPHPAFEVVRRVNHRRFACELGGGLFEQRYVATRSTVDELLANTGHPWLLKRPLAFAGRGQLRIFGAVDARQSAWIDASLRVDGLVVEPLVEPTLELSVHGFVWPDGGRELGNICVQELSVRGVFRTIRRSREGELADADTRALLDSAQRVARALADAGYFGPFGIDAYRYRFRGTEALCVLGEVNARYTMGFATGFPRHPSELALHAESWSRRLE